jgi:hypothetical protein
VAELACACAPGAVVLGPDRPQFAAEAKTTAVCRRELKTVGSVNAPGRSLEVGRLPLLVPEGKV